MNDNKYFYNALCNGIVWTAACGLIGYAIKKTGRLSPLWALLLVPSFSIKTASNNNEEETNYDDTEEPESIDSADAEV